jgi:phosphate transport system protein
MIKTHIDRAYNSELQLLRDRILLIAGRVEKMIANSVRALVHDDVELARETIDYDKSIDRDELLIDRLCIELLARRQPLGHDLRFIVAVIKMVTYFERLGDLAVKVCQRVIKLKRSNKRYDLAGIEELAAGVQNMIKDTLDAFFREDYKKACLILRHDKVIDDMYHAISKRYIQEMANNSQDFENYFHLLSVTRWLERMGDHCTNLAELIIFMIKGEDVRHNHIEIDTSDVD